MLAVSIVSAADNNATSDIVCVEQNQIIEENDNFGTFTDLANEVANTNNELNLTRDYSYTNNDSAYIKGITIKKSIVINGNGFTVNGNNQARIFQISASNVTLKNICFKNAYCDSAGAISGSGNNCVLTNCSFMNCSAKTEVGAVSWNGNDDILTKCEFIGCSARSIGAVEWMVNNGILANCSFKDNHADSTGAISCHGSSYCVLANCTFINNFAVYEGGCIIWGSSNGIAYNCSFVNCSANKGGALFWDGDDGTISNCNFVNCHASNEGGAIIWYGNQGIVSNCNFANCSAKNGGAIRWAGGYYNLGENAKIISNRFEKNTASGTGTAIYGAGTNPQVSDNIFINGKKSDGTLKWEGISQFDNNIFTGDRLVSTKLTADNLTAIYNSGKSLVAILSDVNGKAINGVQVNVILGDVIRNLTTDSNGQVSLSIEGITPNDYVAKISFSGNEIYSGSNTTTRVVINKMNTILTASNLTVVYDEDNYLIATLKDIYGNPITNAPVGFGNNGLTYVTTDANGQAKYSTKNLNAGEYTVKMRYYGNENYRLSNQVTVKIVVNKANAVLSSSDVSVAFDDDGYLIATLRDAHGKAISNAPVCFGNNGLTYVTTDANGQAKYSTKNLNAGEYTVKMRFYGNENYRLSNQATVKITVNKANTLLTATDISATYNEDSYLVATLKDTHGTPIANATVGFGNNGLTYISTDENGEAKYSTKDLDVGEYVVKMRYYGNDNYRLSNQATAKVTITK